MLYFVADLKMKEQVDVSKSYESANFTDFGEVIEKPVHRTGKLMVKVGVGKEYPVTEFLVGEEHAGKRRIAFVCNRVDHSMANILNTLENSLKEKTGFDYSLENIKEVLLKDYEMFVKEARELRSRIDFGTEFFARDANSDSSLLRRDTDCLLANVEFKRELERICSNENKKIFLGNFVHYVLKTTDKENASTMVNMLVGALYRNKRLLSKRILELKLEKFREYPFDEVFNQVRGATLVVNLQKEKESIEQLRKIRSYINRYAKDVLVIMISDKDSKFVEFFCEPLKVKILEIEDGTCDRKDALEFIQNQVKNNKALQLFYFDPDLYLEQQTYYSYDDLMGAVNACADSIVSERFYKSYQGVEFTASHDRKTNASKQECYDELDSIIGLENVKTLIKRIVSLAKYNKKRDNVVSYVGKKPSLHMCFKGNPGTAKTTMARLLGKILKSEGVLRTGNFVECGRADLVGKYVGWTAPAVRKKFQEASGGILFIDEAYSFAEDKNNFAAEAIDTIVAEMENHRDDVLVIFAGYPDKMDTFLDMNEGLRSRIPHHLTFPDYSVEELFEIIMVMAKEQGYVLTEDAQIAATEIFAIAKEQNDFGNGRYARNLLEQVILNHVERVMAKEELSEDDMIYLDAQDFGELDSELSDESKECRKIGFVF